MGGGIQNKIVLHKVTLRVCCDHHNHAEDVSVSVSYHSWPVPRVPTRDIASAVFMVTTFVLHLSRTSHLLDVEDFILMPSVRIIIYLDIYLDYHSLLLKIRHTQISRYLDR